MEEIPALATRGKWHLRQPAGDTSLRSYYLVKVKGKANVRVKIGVEIKG